MHVDKYSRPKLRFKKYTSKHESINTINDIAQCSLGNRYKKTEQKEKLLQYQLTVFISPTDFRKGKFCT